MFVTKTTYSVLTVLSLALIPGVLHADEPSIDSVEVATEDESTVISLGLDAQVRYGLRDNGGPDPISAFALRRFRPILGFQAFDFFEARLVPEFAGDPELKDAVVGWSPTESFSLEAGQYAPPFNWERDGSSDYHQFTERSVANDEFQIADGRDIGVQFDLERDEIFDIEAGIFNGAGSNTEVDPGRGHIVTGRVAYAPVGPYHEVEVIPDVVDQPVIMVAIGAFYAFDNAWRDWAPESGSDTRAEADLWSVTADAHAWIWRFSVHAQGFYREVSPDTEGVDTYAGAGFTGQAGVLIVDELLLAAFRYSLAAPDMESSNTANELAASLQIFHLGNRSKFTLDAGLVDRQATDATERYIRLQYQILL